MTKNYKAIWMLLILLNFAAPNNAPAQSTDENRALIEEQAKIIEELRQKVDQLEEQVNSTSQVAGTAEQSGAAMGSEEDNPFAVRMEGGEPIGSLNPVVLEGDFPNSIMIPGPGQTSLRFGGFVKTVAWRDSDKEDGINFFPATLGIQNDDTAGQSSISADLTRINLDARAPARNGTVRGFVEYDFNKNNDSDFNLRHAFLEWADDKQQLLAGETWSSFMDMSAVPESVIEPTVSGAIFARQAQIRYRRNLGKDWTWTFSAEDPDTNDVVAENPLEGRTTIPDLITTIKYGQSSYHLQLGGIFRRLEADTDTGNDDASAWGLHGSGGIALGEKDRLVGAYVYGEGVGRYLLGISPTSAGVVTPDDEFELRDNKGGYVSYARRWNDTWRTNIAVGYAEADNLDLQPDDAFNKSTYAFGNVIYSFNEHISIGLEYAYGERENKDGSDIDNHRVALAFQLF